MAHAAWHGRRAWLEPGDGWAPLLILPTGGGLRPHGLVSAPLHGHGLAASPGMVARLALVGLALACTAHGLCLTSMACGAERAAVGDNKSELRRVAYLLNVVRIELGAMAWPGRIMVRIDASEPVTLFHCKRPCLMCWRAVVLSPALHVIRSQARLCGSQAVRGASELCHGVDLVHGLSAGA